MKMDINITDIDSDALEYIIDLVQRDMKDNAGNPIRGFSLFQNVNFLSNLLQQEVYIAKRDAREAAKVGA